MNPNPIIRGFNPDPSIIRLRDRYFIAVSTFEFFPGVTLYESRDLVNWHYHSSVLTRESQLDLKGCPNSRGVYAATIREYDGRIYMVTTNKNFGFNFFVYTDDIDSGNWSEPRFVRQGGIDPSLFFEDGKCFYCSNGVVDGVRGILGFYIDPETGKALSEETLLTEGISHHATEAPHIYKKDGWYYLIIAEGGTGYGHHECVLRSKNILGPYEAKREPILSHVDKKGSPVQATGHADMVEKEDGSWVAVFLGIRMKANVQVHNLGRESFIAPVTWEGGWPMIGNNGIIPDDVTAKATSLKIDFSKPLSDYPFLKVKRPQEELYIRENDGITIKASADPAYPALLALRQSEFCSSFKAEIDLSRLKGHGGITAFYNSDYFYKLDVSDETVKVVARVHGYSSIAAEMSVPTSGYLALEITSDIEYYHLKADGKELFALSVAGLSSEATMYMTFTGALFALYSDEGEAFFRNVELSTEGV
jgi:Beta-xylosidase